MVSVGVANEGPTPADQTFRSHGYLCSMAQRAEKPKHSRLANHRVGGE